jgi:hypothetical protein
LANEILSASEDARQHSRWLASASLAFFVEEPLG